jgi:serine/threonine protein kinase
MTPQELSNYIKLQKNELSTSIGLLKITKNIGQGGNGVVYAGQINGNSVAVKFLVTEATGSSLERKEARFLSEYFNIMLLNEREYVVKYINFCKIVFNANQKSISFIVMDLYEGSLNGLESSPNEDTFINLFNFLISSVDFIHNSGIIHRDIKPENILIKNSKFVLADFGIASYNPEIFELRAITKGGERLGNRLFSAPEQEEAGIAADKTMDIYAIGQVLQWYATGKTHRGTGRIRITSIFPTLKLYDDIIEKCLSNSPKRRFQTISEIRNYIKEVNNSHNINPFTNYLYPFDRICRSNFPKTINDVAYSNDTRRIDKLFENISNQSKDFLRNLWWKGDGDMYFNTIQQESPGVWQINETEYSIEKLWIYNSQSIQRNFILFKHSAGVPISVDGHESYYTVMVDDTFFITDIEYHNGYAEVNNEVIELSEHKVKVVNRMRESGFIIIATAYNNIMYHPNKHELESFLKLAKSTTNLSVEQVSEFGRQSKSTHPDVSIWL